MPVKIIISDVDGCLVKEDKTKPPLLEDLDPHIKDLQAIRDFLLNHPDVIFSICTTRSFSSGIRIAEIAGINGFSAFENGNVIYNPLTGESYLLIQKEKSLAYLQPILDKLRQWYGTIDENVLADDLGISQDNLRRLSDRKTLLTFEILPFDSPPVSGHDLWRAIEKRFLTSEISDILASGNVKVVPSASALDISLKVDKGYATRHILGLYDLSKENALGIGDSYHSDTALLAETNYQGVPSNANQKLKEAVHDTSNGFIADKPYGRGILDILHRFL
ncbi:HAD family phosphatase [Candidatus Woesearchaeota archaeon]|nr:HAD family phosphatase [Candidatus Woesearchaeota archaeon]